MITVKRALLSVSDKTGLVELAGALEKNGAEIVSTGGTAKALREAGITAVEISELTGFPELLDGRVKTLHPKIFGGILFRREADRHQRQVQEHDIPAIDLVAVNLYPFEKVVAGDCDLATAIENIDIGGPSLLRAAAKNSSHVVVLSDPVQYEAVIRELERNQGKVSEELARELGAAVFTRTALYDRVISLYLDREKPGALFPARELLLLEKAGELRYGENSHQQAAIYREKSFAGVPGLLVNAEKLQGKELSFNNYLDLEAAVNLAREFDQEAAVVIKHNNPCGTALGPDVLTAFRKAKSGDPVSAFGSVVALNRPVDEETAREITRDFVECVVAPEFNRNALAVFAQKPDLRLLRLPWKTDTGARDFRKISGGFLVQEPDASLFTELKIAGTREPSAAQLEDLKFAYAVAKNTKSNAIVLARDGQTIGVGAGQMSRLDSARIAVSKARDFGFEIKGSVAASDAFFPFPDALEVLAKEGIAAVIQPGGSRKDAEVLQTAEQYEIAMVMAGQRHFRH